MAGYVPGQQPANRSQEKEFVQAYEDVLERYKGAAGAGAGAGGSLGTGVRGRPGGRGVALQVRCRWGGRAGSRPPQRRGWPLGAVSPGQFIYRIQMRIWTPLQQ